jgi:GTP cyclohydrolase IA
VTNLQTLAKGPANETSRPSRAEAEAAFRTIIRWAGDDPGRDGLLETPGRLARAFEDSLLATAGIPEKSCKKPLKRLPGMTR